MKIVSHLSIVSQLIIICLNLRKATEPDKKI